MITIAWIGLLALVSLIVMGILVKLISLVGSTVGRLYVSVILVMSVAVWGLAGGAWLLWTHGG